jgi:DNA-directed RNA polymerase subunit RPC12/RpoP
MAIAFECPRCQSQIQVSDDERGTKLRCPACQGKVRVPDAPSTALPMAARFAPPAAAIEFQCPRCRTAIKTPGAQAGAKLRCPQCQGKVRVPVPVPPPSRSIKIDFLCPRCAAEMTARPEHAGTKQFCPRCGGKVRVPAPQAVAPATAEQAASIAAPQPPIAASIAAIADEDELEGLPLPLSHRHKRNYLGWMVPVACLGLLAAIGSVLMKKPPVKFEGTLVGERLTDVELGPVRIDNSRLGRSKLEAQRAFDNLDAAPLRAVTQSLILEFKGAQAWIEVSLRTSDQTEFFQVDPGKDKRLAAFIDDNKQKFRVAVDEELDRSIPEFLAAVEKRTERDREVQGLADFRDSVGLASLMRGAAFGYHVQAAIGKQAYPCALEDNQGRLFFALPTGTQEFELVGRDRAPKSATDAPRFTGRYTVHISDHTITIKKETSDGNEKVRKALRK